jgi:hypothetical protein
MTTKDTETEKKRVRERSRQTLSKQLTFLKSISASGLQSWPISQFISDSLKSDNVIFILDL